MICIIGIIGIIGDYSDQYGKNLINRSFTPWAISHKIRIFLMLGHIHKLRQIKFSCFKEFFTVRLYLCLYKCYSLPQDASNELSQVWGLYNSYVTKQFLNILTGFLNTFQNFQNIFRILASSLIHKYILCI